MLYLFSVGGAIFLPTSVTCVLSRSRPPTRLAIALLHAIMIAQGRYLNPHQLAALRDAASYTLDDPVTLPTLC